MYVLSRCLFGPSGTILLRNFWGYDDQVLDSIVGRYMVEILEKVV